MYYYINRLHILDSTFLAKKKPVKDPPSVKVITGNLNVILDVRVRNIISKCHEYRFPSNIEFPKRRREIAATLNDFSNR